jgi:hypothetical protein
VKKNLAGSSVGRGGFDSEDDSDDDDPRALPGSPAASGSADGQPGR